MLTLPIILAIGSSITVTFVQAAGKKVTRAVGRYMGSLIYLVIALIFPAIIIALIPPSGIAPIYLLATVVCGLLYAAALVLVLKSIETEQASNTWALGNIGILPLILVGALILSEPINIYELIGTIVVVIGSLMITITEDFKFNKNLVPSLIGNCLFGVYAAIGAYTVAQNPQAFDLIYPLAYVVAAVALVIYGSSTNQFGKALKGLRKPGIAPLALLLGIVGSASLAMWIFVVHLKTIALGGSISLVEPALVVVYAYLLFKERLTPLQTLGVLVSIIGAAMVSLL